MKEGINTMLSKKHMSKFKVHINLCHQGVIDYDGITLRVFDNREEFEESVTYLSKHITEYIPEFIKVHSKEDLRQPNIRVFYEISIKINPKLPVSNDNVKKSGLFKEVLNIEEFLQNDRELSREDYIKHHNFQTLKNENNSNFFTREVGADDTKNL